MRFLKQKKNSPNRIQDKTSEEFKDGSWILFGEVVFLFGKPDGDAW